MKRVDLLGKYKRDLKRIEKRNWDRRKLNTIVNMLICNETLPISAHPHKLSGEWLGFWECHIDPDWLLVYDVTDEAVLLAGTGSHADLFE